MLFNIDIYKKKNISLKFTFTMEGSLDKVKLSELCKVWKENGGVTYIDALEVLKSRTSTTYYNEIDAAQSQAVDYSRIIFPAYEFLMADVLYDDWMSIMDPHQKRKRDHSFHQPLTAFVVSELLGGGKAADALQINGQSLLTKCANLFLTSPKMEYLRSYLHDLHPSVQITGNMSRQMLAESLFYQAAIMAALFHDIGYPWQYIHTVCKGIGLANASVQAGTSFTPEGIYNQIENRLLIAPFYGYNMSAIGHVTSEWKQQILTDIEGAFHNTHGFPGALAFQYLNDMIRKFPINSKFSDAVFRFIQDWAAVAIMMHDMVWEYYGKEGYVSGKTPAKPKYRLSFDTDPLSCLIAMADILEEFGRPLASFDQKEDSMTTTFEYPCIGSELTVNGSTMLITYQFKDVSQAVKYNKKRSDEKKRYFNEECGFIDMRAIGIEKVE